MTRTKAQNAELLKQAFGVEIDPKASKPLAETLQTWADALETDREGVRKQVLAFQLEEALGIELVPDNFTADQLQGWLARAEAEKPAVINEMQATVVSQGAQPGAEGSVAEKVEGSPAPLPETLSARVNDRIAKYGGTFTDADQEEGKRVIGSEAVEVQRTRLVNEALRNGTLVEG